MSFFYKIIDNFLPEEELKRISKLYETLQFKEIKSDLFCFLQSNELAEDERFEFFKERICSAIKSIIDSNINSDTVKYMESGSPIVKKDMESGSPIVKKDMESGSPIVKKDMESGSPIEKKDKHISSINNGYFTFFASFYRKSDFLLCHDDMVDERLYAFTFYLEDFSSGNLILYEDDCKTIHKRIDVISNRIVFFEVCKNSFHEVDFCNSEGRKAISGWFNQRGRKNEPERVEKKTRPTVELVDFGEEFNLSVEESIKNNDFLILDFQNSSNDCNNSSDDYNNSGIDCNTNTNNDSTNNNNNSNNSNNNNNNNSNNNNNNDDKKYYCCYYSGPFINRRVCINPDIPLYAPRIKGYELIHCEEITLKEGCYILCNDIINHDIEEDLLDIFIFKNENTIDGFINYVDDDSNTVFKLDAIDGKMMLGRRNGHSLCINRLKKGEETRMRHMIYTKTNFNNRMID